MYSFNDMKTIFQKLYVQACIKALLAAIIYLFVTFYWYNIELVRGKIGDLAFDTINKFSIKNTSVEIDKSKILLFDIDNLYMKKYKLYDDKNISNYGYIFPRLHIVDFMTRLDELVNEITPRNRPKALFIDFDMSFTSMPGGKVLSSSDQILLDVLKKPREYTIFLPKTSVYNFVEYSKDNEIQKAIKDKKIIFVSVSFLESVDGNIRRYKSYKQVDNKEYMGVWIALWQLLGNKKVDLDASKKYFSDHDILLNRIWIKSYEHRNLEKECLTSRSYWDNLTKYSANCSLFDIVEEDFSDSVLMLGASYTQSSDKFNILNSFSFFGVESSSGIDLHANTLMTMVYLNPSMKRLPIMYSFLLVFISFFILDWLILYVYEKFNLKHGDSQFILLLACNTIIFYTLSSYLLTEWHLWFNWLMPIILFEIVDIGQRFGWIPLKLWDRIVK